MSTSKISATILQRKSTQQLQLLIPKYSASISRNYKT